MSEPRHDSGDLPVTDAAQQWCDGRYVRSGEAHHSIVRFWHMFVVLGLLISAVSTVGGVAYAQLKGESKDAKAAVEKAEARLVKAMDDKKADDDKKAEALAKKLEKQEEKRDREEKESSAERNAMHVKLQLILQALDVRQPRGVPKAEDFKRAEAP